ncbi:restriction endonuclease subunit S [Candidatus Avelusimicrobium sp.]|uniref:restriction endonuclease subunit S n=1 Tax=Candidatus Avelusimicrobium sp. TaxID=3048833 RepID=UPI003F7D3B1A
MKKTFLSELLVAERSQLSGNKLELNSGIYPVYGANGLVTYINFYEVDKPYLAVIKDGAGIGRVYKCPSKSSVLSTLQYLLPNSKIDLNYAYYWLSSLCLSKYAHGAAIPHIYYKDYKYESLLLPSLMVQKKIAERLDKVQKLIAKQKEQIATLDLLIKSRFLDMFGDPITNPKGWIVRQIGQVSKIVSGTTPSTQNPIYWQGNLPWLTPAEIPDNMNYINNTQRKISLKAVRDCSLRLLPRGTVILSSRAPIGKVAIAGVPLYCNQGFKNLILDDKQMNAVFVCYLLRQRVTEIISLGRGATFKEISKDIVSHISIYVPPLFLQNQFANFVKSVEQQKEVFSARLSHLEVLYKSLIQEYFG